MSEAAQRDRGIQPWNEAGEDRDCTAGLVNAVLDELDYGLVLVGVRGRILLRNETARRELATGLLMQERANTLTVVDDGAAYAFLKAMDRARNGVREVMVLKAKQRTLTCAMIPLAGESNAHRNASERSTPVLLILGRRQLCSPLTIALFSRSLGLTSAEAAVLGALSNGLDPGDIAKAHQVDISTIRTQLLSIRNKMDAPSLRRLIERLAQLPQVVPRVHDCNGF